MKSRVLNDKAIRMLPWILLSCLAAMWILYMLFGRSLIDALHNSKSPWPLNEIMEGRMKTPVENYYRAAESLLREVTWWVLIALVLSMLLFKKPRETITLLTTAVIFLTIGEFAARYFLRDITTTSDNSSYFARRWHETVRHNSWGFREKEFALKKPPEVYRIAVIGDSITYGQGIAEEDRFTNILERSLIGEGTKGVYEVLNFGRPGSETVDHLEILMNPVLHASPDFVLLQWYPNDVEGHDKSQRPSALPLAPSGLVLSKARRSSALFYLLNQQWITLQWRLGLLPSYNDYILQRFGDPHSPPSVTAAAELRKFIKTCRESGIDLGMLLFDTGTGPLDFLTDRTLELCKEERIPCLDLRPTFNQYKVDRVNRLDSHPGPLANRIVADRLMETFGKAWVR